MNSKIMKKKVLNNIQVVYKIANGVFSSEMCFPLPLQRLVGFLTARCSETLALYAQMHNVPN